MIKLNKMTDYGTVLLSVLASYYAREPMRLLSSVELARKSGLTQTTTQKLLKSLAGTDFVEAERGKTGGYRLIKSPRDISIAEIVEACSDPAIKEQLINNTEQSVARGNFGSPTFFVGTEMFFGKDKLVDVEDEITRQLNE